MINSYSFSTILNRVVGRIIKGVLPFAEYSTEPTLTSGQAHHLRCDDKARMIASVPLAEGCTTSASTTGVITPSDSTEFPSPVRCFYSTTAGIITVVLWSDSTNVFPIPVEANQVITSLEVRKIKLTGTTVTGTIYGAL